MNLNGNLIIGLKDEAGSEKEVSAKNPSTNDTLSPGYKGATAKQLEHACDLANNAFYKYKNTSFEDRAKFLDTIAEEIEAVKETLLKITPEETGLNFTGILSCKFFLYDLQILLIPQILHFGFLGIQIFEP